MLQLRPSCEHCAKALAPDSTEARICSFECTFCSDCVENVLHNVCPNCGGGFVPRPVRPANKLANNPASNVQVVKPVDIEQHEAVSLALRDIPAERR
jgi:hypothetical protein